MIIEPHRVIVLDDGRAGHLAQSLGVAEALGVGDPRIVPMPVRERWQRLGRLAFALPIGLRHAPITTAAREIVIATGTRNGRVLAWLKRRDRSIFAIQVLSPPAGLMGPLWDAFDAVILPAHDLPPARANVCITTAALSRVTAARLAREAAAWSARLGHLPAPRLAVLVGGASRHGAFGLAEVDRLADDILGAARSAGMSLMVTTSRRTGGPATARLRAVLAAQTDVPVEVWSPERGAMSDNPYFAFLALAECIVVTGDSISMISEAATAGKPVYAWGVPETLPDKVARLLARLAGEGRARFWPGAGGDARLDLPPPATPLEDSRVVAGFLAERLGNPSPLAQR